MRILGIDPGLQRCGWGVIESEGHALRFIACGHIETSPAEEMARRLAAIHEGILNVIKTYEPERAAIEETFVNRNPASALKLGQARGVAMAVPALCGISVSEYSPNTIKKSIVGAGHAAKAQMGMMVKVLLPACDSPSADEADALAVAVTHAHYSQFQVSRYKLQD
jgi:crossover junction endodeoxyribonuclease RuvC